MAQRLATVRAAWNADRSKMVPDTSEEARVIAYPVGTELAAEDVDAYEAFLLDLEVEPSEDTADHGAEGAEPLLAEHRVWVDSQGNFVHERHPLAATLRYAVNDVVAPDDVEAYRDMGDPPQGEPGRGVVIVAQQSDAEGKATPGAAKRKPSKAQTRSTAGTAENVTDPDAAGKADTVTVEK